MARFSFEDEAVENHNAGTGDGDVAPSPSEVESELVSKKRKRDDDDEEGIDVRIDPDVLDCTICYEPLQAPIFQCQNGHVACSSCYSKLLNKCHLCSQTIGFSRCLALEKVIESMKVSCSYAKFGCNKAVPFIETDAHKKTCIFAPCLCPVTDCKFSGSRELLSVHFMTAHIPDRKFKYDWIFSVMLRKTEPFQVLYGEDGHLFLLLNNNVPNMGNALSIICLRPSTPDCDFMYEIVTDKYMSRCKSSCLQLSSRMTNLREWKGTYPMKFYLLVPPEFCCPLGKIVLNIRIWKVDTSVV